MSTRCRISEQALCELWKPVDVLVVGGTAPCVAAAAEAARNGARTALLSPRPFLGDDLCETSMYTELHAFKHAADPLLAAISQCPKELLRLPPTIPFTYTLQGTVDAEFPDSTEKPVLTDHRSKLFAKGNGIVMNSDAVVTLTLTDGPQKLDSVVLMMFQNGHAKIEKMSVEARCEDGSWKAAGVVSNGDIDNVHTRSEMPLKLALNGLTTDALRLGITMLPVEPRMILAEICVVTTAAAEEVAKRPDPLLTPYPMTVKRALETELLENNVDFLYDIHVADVLRDDNGNLAGVVAVSRSGAQYIRAKAILDGTENGLVARLAGAAFRKLPALPRTFTRYVLGGDGVTADGATMEKLPAALQITGGGGQMPSQQPVWKYTFKEKLTDVTIGNIMALENKTRDMTWNRRIVEVTGRLAYTVGQRIVGRAACDAVIPTDAVPMDCIRPASLPNLLVLGRNADVCAALSDQLQTIDNGIALGRRAGTFAASLRNAPLTAVATPRRCTKSPLRLNAMPHRFSENPMAFCGNDLPVLGTYDVVVVGGGTGGAPAAIGAARQGAKTLLLEYLNDFGGTCTMGSINNYCFGNICGFTTEMDDAIGHDIKPWAARNWSRVLKSNWLRSALLEKGGEIWTSVLVFGTLMTGNRVVGVAISTPFGPGVVYAHTVIDGTGNADVAAAAGAPCMDQDEELGVQGVGLSPVRVGDDYVNTDYLFHDDSDVIDVWRSFVLGRERYKTAADINPIIGTRERRRIVGDEIVMPMDIYNMRTFPDTICLSKSNFDTHGYTCHPLFFVLGPDSERISASVPFRALLPKGIDGIEVIGLAISGHRDTMPILRMQPDVQNHGYAAGVAAAMAAKAKVDVRHIDIKALQKHLVDIGNLAESTLTDVDSYPLPIADVSDAVENICYDHRKLSVIMASMDVAMPMMRKAYKHGSTAEKQYLYALIMAFYGDAIGKSTLLAELAKAKNWDDGWNFRGMGQFGPSSSHLDALIVALGAIKATEARKDIIRLTKMLDCNSFFSHFRAVSLALSAIGDRNAANALADVLKLPGMMGHDQPVGSNPRDFAAMANPDWRRSEELRELFMGVALYRCGDVDGIGKDVLTRFANDGRGIYARHATFVLTHASQTR